MTQETKHTPTPHYHFVCIEGELIGSLYKRTFNSEGGCMLETPVARNIMKHHADEIVRACNAHDGLVAYAECKQAFACGVYHIYEPVLIRHGWDKHGVITVESFMNKMGASALAKARGEA